MQTFRNPVDRNKLPVIRHDQFHDVYRNMHLEFQEYYKHTFVFSMVDEINQLCFRMQVAFPGGEGMYRFLVKPTTTVWDIYDQVAAPEEVANDEIGITYWFKYTKPNGPEVKLGLVKEYDNREFEPGQPVTWYDSRSARKESGIFKKLATQEGRCFVVFNTLQPENWENLTAANVVVDDLRHGWLLKDY